MAKIEGRISITGLPPHRGLLVNLCFFPVAGPDAPVPYDGEPPSEAVTESHKVYEDVDLDHEATVSSVEISFATERPLGYSYIQIRTVLFGAENGKVFAQAEQFFFWRRALHIDSDHVGNIVFPVTWPSMRIEDLEHYGTVYPSSKRPWWRFW